MQRRTKLILFAIGGSVLSLAAIASVSGREHNAIAGADTTPLQATPTVAIAPPREVYPPPGVELNQAEASWAWSYGSLSMLVVGSDLVATGTITAANPSRDENGSLSTDYTFSLDEVVTGPGEPSDEVTVYQTGGVMNGEGMEIHDDPLMRVGNRLLLFLRSGDDSESARIYYTIGGPQGRYPIDDAGMVGALGDLYPDRNIEQVNGIAGRPLADVLAEAETYRDLPPLDYRHPTTPQDPNYRPRE